MFPYSEIMKANYNGMKDISGSEILAYCFILLSTLIVILLVTTVGRERKQKESEMELKRTYMIEYDEIKGVDGTEDGRKIGKRDGKRYGDKDGAVDGAIDASEGYECDHNRLLEGQMNDRLTDRSRNINIFGNLEYVDSFVEAYEDQFVKSYAKIYRISYDESYAKSALIDSLY